MINSKSPSTYLTSLLCCSKNKEKMVIVNASDATMKHKAISGCLSEYFGFKLSSDVTV